MFCTIVQASRQGMSAYILTLFVNFNLFSIVFHYRKVYNSNMEEIIKSKQFIILKWIFIAVSIVYIVYASITMRGMYEDGGFYMIMQLENMANHKLAITFDPAHPRFFMLAIPQLFTTFCYEILFIHSKKALMMIYTFAQFVLPFLALIWNYKLSKRTKRFDIFFWSLFIYGAINITFSIFSVVESLLGSMLSFILWNYLAGEIEYTKKDIFAIIFLITMMFATYEYIAVLGIIFFIASFYYALKNDDDKTQLIKTIIGWGALFASLFNIVYMIKVPNESSELLRFLKEAHDFIPYCLDLNLLITIVTVILLVIIAFKKKQLGIISIILISLIYVYLLIRLYNTPLMSVYPMWEQHFRTIPCYIMPIVFIIMYLTDRFGGVKNPNKYLNLICIVLMCSITQTLWQNVNTYYWDNNIQYMRSELNKAGELLYIPSEHEEISSFYNDKLRRYIWHGIYAPTSILFSDNYEQKTLLVNYDECQDEGNLNFREWLFIPKNMENKMAVPYGGFISIKNEFWDLTACAKALDKYNKEHQIQTRENLI